MTLLRKTLDALYWVCGAVAGLCIVAICALMMAMSLGREIGINVSGGDEVAGWLMAAMAFLGLAHTFKHGDLIRVTLVIERFTGATRRWLELLAIGTGGLFLGLFAWYCVRMVYDSWRFNEFAQGVIAIPIWIPQSGLALGVVVLFVAFLDEFVRVLAGHAPCYHREPPKTADEIIERAAESGV
ncbi:TRAP transporter small permease subunit [Reyranella sp. CPCC 100927]|uniref:TRAP transporter small permease subunit n=1 Tax=Reyranella sp. CPCC 100927 TaxID=2599616 RepID=UPI0011B70615|nr:TRAP transporter small permease [Reyranella sp. CPCC 100927]TWT13648.1 TRAP transporter small permease [Reyranella sp. CPCC 100927]